MPRKARPTLDSLLAEGLILEEDAGTIRLIERLRRARIRGYLTRAELLLVARWKSPRSIRLVESNSAGRVRRATAAAFRTDAEWERMAALTALRGVSIPTASSALTLL